MCLYIIYIFLFRYKTVGFHMALLFILHFVDPPTNPLSPLSPTLSQVKHFHPYPTFSFLFQQLATTILYSLSYKLLKALFLISWIIQEF